jgi:exopolysaccharide biosynthesis polyprenyl glycosylphosphotransferase
VSEGPIVPSRNGTKSSPNGAQPPRSGTGSPPNGSEQSRNGAARARNGAVAARNGSAQPGNGAAARNGAAPAQNGVARPHDDIAPVQNGVTPLPDGVAQLPLRALRSADDIPARRSRRHRRAIAWLLDGPGWPWVAVSLDLLATGLALLLALAWTGGADAAGGLAPLLAFPLIAVTGLWLARGRALHMDAGMLDDAWPLVAAISLAGMVASGLDQATGPHLDAATLPVAWAAAVVLAGAAHAAVRLARRVTRLRGFSDRPTLIVGAGPVGARIGRRLAARPHYGLRPVGFLDWAAPPAAAVGGRPAPVLGEPTQLAEVIRRTRAEQVVLAFPSHPDSSLVPLVRTCEALDVGVALVPRLFESTNERMTYEPVGGVPLLTLHSAPLRGPRVALKHALDRMIAAALLLLALPLLAVIALATMAGTGGPVLFRQRRVGQDGREFDLLKFRTMRGEPSGEEALPPIGSDRAPGGVEDGDRRTAVGRLLRRTSLDELPQLVNVLRSEMSLVGPRPERPSFVELYSEALDRYSDRHRMRPGITGCAQVKGLRGQTSLSERVELDNYYIEHWSFTLDMKILLRTVLAAFRVPE